MPCSEGIGKVSKPKTKQKLQAHKNLKHETQTTPTCGNVADATPGNAHAKHTSTVTYILGTKMKDQPY